MTINGYTMLDSHNVLNKTLTPVFSLTGTLKDKCSVTDPVILIEATSVTANYFQIPEFNRYYFLTDAPVYRNGFWELHLHVDVLYTYRAALLNCNVIMAKSESRYNLYINDDEYVCEQDPVILTKAFPSGFDTSNACYILALIGDKSRTHP